MTEKGAIHLKGSCLSGHYIEVLIGGYGEHSASFINTMKALELMLQVYVKKAEHENIGR